MTPKRRSCSGFMAGIVVAVGVALALYCLALAMKGVWTIGWILGGGHGE